MGFADDLQAGVDAGDARAAEQGNWFTDFFTGGEQQKSIDKELGQPNPNYQKDFSEETNLEGAGGFSPDEPETIPVKQTDFWDRYKAGSSFDPKVQTQAILKNFLADHKDSTFRYDKERDAFFLKEKGSDEEIQVDRKGLDEKDLGMLLAKYPSITAGGLGMSVLYAAARAATGKKGKFLGALIRGFSGLVGGTFGGSIGGAIEHSNAERMGDLDHLTDEEKTKHRLGAVRAGAIAEGLGFIFGRSLTMGVQGVRKFWNKWWMDNTMIDQILKLPEDSGPLVKEVNQYLTAKGVPKEALFKPGAYDLQNNKDLASAVAAIAHSGLEGYEHVAKVWMDNQASLTRFLDEVNKVNTLTDEAPLPGRLDPKQNLEAAVKADVTEPVEQAAARHTADIEGSQATSTQQLEALATAKGKVTTASTGQATREAVESQAKHTEDKFSAAYDHFRQIIATNAKGDPAQVRNEALRSGTETALAKLNKGQTAGLPSDAGIKAELNAFLENASKKRADGSLTRIPSYSTTLETFDALRHVRAKRRNAYAAHKAGTDTTGAYKVLDDVETLIASDFADRLKIMPKKAIERWEKLENAYKAKNEYLGQEGIALFRETGKYGMKHKSGTLFKKIFGPDDASGGNVHAFMDLLEKGKNQDVIENFRKSVLDDFLRRTKGSKKGTISTSKADAYLNTRKEALERVLTPEQFAQLKKANSQGELVQKFKDLETAWKNKLPTDAKAELRGLPTNKIFDTYAGDVTHVRKFRDIYKEENPQIWQAFQNHVMADFRAKWHVTETVTGKGKDVLDFKAIKASLAENSSSRNVMKELYGEEYVKQMDNLVEAKLITEPVSTPRQGVTAGAGAAADMINQYRKLIFGQLDSTSFRLRMARAIMGDKREEALQRMVLDPEKLLYVAKTLRGSQTRDALFNAFGAATGPVAWGNEPADASRKDMESMAKKALKHQERYNVFNPKDMELMEKIREAVN